MNGASLTDVVSAFEREHQFEPGGGYGGLIQQWFEYGPLDRYFEFAVAPIVRDTL